MTQKVDNGGEAFPVSHMADHGAFGMSLRDYFAAKALQGLIAAEGREGSPGWFVEAAYMLADAMIEEKRRTGK
jgi:hypothetical protein